MLQKAISKSIVKTVIASANKKQGHSYTVNVKVSCYLDAKQYYFGPFSTRNRPFPTNDHVVQNPPCWRASSLLLNEENKSRSRHNVEGSFLCVLYFGWPNQPSSGIFTSGTLYLKKAGLASRNIVHTKKILLRCVDFCFYFLHFICEAD